MQFYVIETNEKPQKKHLNSILLEKDNWNDWFEFKTMYTVHYINSEGYDHLIGSVKIGELDMVENQERPNIPDEFEQLSNSFFSLGQSDSYYEKLNNLIPNQRSEFLLGLNDIALDVTKYDLAINEYVTKKSIMRGVSRNTVISQYRRMANGGARLTPFEFSYQTPEDDKSETGPIKLTFNVKVESNPPTNIHVLIGRNGVGKTSLVKKMIMAIINEKDNVESYGHFKLNEFNDDLYTSGLIKSNTFANIVCVAFSAFDDFNEIKAIKKDIPFSYIGLPENSNTNLKNGHIKSLFDDFYQNLNKCNNGYKKQLWISEISSLESDPIFKHAQIGEWINGYEIENSRKNLLKKNMSFKENLFKNFDMLSSGHKIILLIITKLVASVEEKTLVFLDEPEGHLHPPLLSAFIRTLSNLLVHRNGVAIVATHSPVILQEVPKSCVWKLRRNGRELTAERLEIESFGENIGLLTSEIFGLEVTDSGFHKMIVEAVKKFDNYDEIIEHFSDEIGSESRAIIRSLLAIKKQEGGI